ncbi:hypothetical protein [Nitrobacter sp. TKz-YC02]
MTKFSSSLASDARPPRRRDSFDFETLLGQKCLLNVVHDETT